MRAQHRQGLSTGQFPQRVSGVYAHHDSFWVGATWGFCLQKPGRGGQQEGMPEQSLKVLYQILVPILKPSCGLARTLQVTSSSSGGCYPLGKGLSLAAIWDRSCRWDTSVSTARASPGSTAGDGSRMGPCSGCTGGFHGEKRLAAERLCLVIHRLLLFCGTGAAVGHGHALKHRVRTSTERCPALLGEGNNGSGIL